jgi:hypothetical protein
MALSDFSSLFTVVAAIVVSIFELSNLSTFMTLGDLS